MSWRGGLRRSIAYFVAIGAGFLLAYLIVAFVIFPAGVVPKDVKVPSVVGLTYDDAESELLKSGFRVKRGETRTGTTAPEGTVIEQTPPGGARELLGNTITLAVSGGQQTASVPNVTGMTRDDAARSLDAAGFRVGDVTEQASPQPRGEIIGQRPSASAQVATGSAVSLLLSSGPGTVTVPDVGGLGVQEARQMLEQLGFRVGVEGDTTMGAAVVSQAPAPNAQVPSGTRITLRARGGGPTP